VYPAIPTFIARINYLNYDGDNSANRNISIAGQTAANVRAKSNAVGLTLFWAPQWGQINDHWNYAMSTTIPWLSMEVSADVTEDLPVGPQQVRLKDKETGLGDIILMPVMFNYKASKDLNANFRLSVYAPSGSYKKGRLANTGKKLLDL
jgi:hypothetical protein